MKSQSTASCLLSLASSSSSPGALHTRHLQLQLQWCQRHWAALCSQSFRDISQWERASVCEGELLPRKLWIITRRLTSLSRFYETGWSHKPDRSLCSGKKTALQIWRTDGCFHINKATSIIWQQHRKVFPLIKKWQRHQCTLSCIKSLFHGSLSCCTVGFQAPEQKDNRLLQFSDCRELLCTQACGSCTGVSWTQNALFWLGLELGRIRWLWEWSSRLTPRGREATGSASEHLVKCWVCHHVGRF